MGNPDQLTPEWWVRIHGEVFDLEALEENVSDEDLEVVRHGDRFYLRALADEKCRQPGSTRRS